MAKKKLFYFTKKELQHDFYPMFLTLINKGLEVEAFIFILSTWNSPRFRFAMKEFDLKAFEEKVKKLRPLFRKMQNKDFRTIDFNKYANEIRTIFDILAAIKGIESTGASKLIHLKLPKVFVMWDRHIRNAYGYKDGNADEYISFLMKMQENFSDTIAKSNRSLAKLIDEHNYKKFTIPALEKAKNKRNKKITLKYFG